MRYLRIFETERRSVVWQPAADIYRAHWGWLIKFELAGVLPEDIELRAHDNRLTVSGTRRDLVAEEGCCHYTLEIPYSRFERTIDLPCSLNHARIDTELHNGMLFVKVTAV